MTCSSHGPKEIRAGTDCLKSDPAVTAGRMLPCLEPSDAPASQAGQRLGPNPTASTRCWAPSAPLPSQRGSARPLAAFGASQAEQEHPGLKEGMLRKMLRKAAPCT